MAFDPLSSPVYGGGTLNFHLEVEVPQECPVYCVFEGTCQRHITLANRNGPSASFSSVIPAHGGTENVQLTVCTLPGDNDICLLQTSSFRYHYDSAYYMAQFLVESVYNLTSLDDLELIRSEHFDLSNELLETLDDRLFAALKYLDIPEWWHLLGPTSPAVSSEHPARETLIHFAARLGLCKVASLLLDKPGSQEALHLANRSGYLPCELAEANGHEQIAEYLKEYNSHLVKYDHGPLLTEYGIITFYDKNQKSFSTVAQRPLFEDVRSFEDLLNRTLDMESSILERQSQTNWPEQNMSSERSIFEDERESKLNAIIEKSKNIHVVMEALGQYDLDDNNSYDLDTVERSNEDLSDAPTDKDGSQEKLGVYEGSVAGVHGFNQQLFKLRDYHRSKLLEQDVRKDNLARFSSSCPSLENEGRGSPVQVAEGEHHNSMLNLAKDVEQSTLESNPITEDTHPQYTDVLSQESLDQSNVQICVNGVTIDSTEDHLDASLNNFLKDYYGGNTPGVRRRSSWGPTLMTQTSKRQRNSKENAVLSRKSSSLHSLDDGESDDESCYHDAKEIQTPRHSCGDLEDQRVSPIDMDALSASPSNSACSSPFNQESSEGGMFGPEMHTESLAKTLYSIQQELVTPRDRIQSKKTLSQDAENTASGQSGDSADDDLGSNLTVPHSNMTKSLSTPSIPAAISPTEKKVFHKDPKHAQFRRQDEIEEDDDETTNRLLGRQNSKSRRRSELSLLDFLNESANFSAEDQAKNARKEEKKRKTSVFSRLQNSYRTKKHKEKENKGGRDTHQYVAVSFSNSTACDVCKKSMANKPAVRCDNCFINVHESCKEQITFCDKNRSMKVPHRALGEGSSMTNIALRDKQLSSPGPSISGLRPTQSFKEKRSSGVPLRSQVTSAPPVGISSANIPLSAIPDSSEPDDSQGGQTETQLLHRRSLPASRKAIDEEGEQANYETRQDLGQTKKRIISSLTMKQSDSNNNRPKWTADSYLRMVYKIYNRVLSELPGVNIPGHPQLSITNTISESLESLDDVDSAVEISSHVDDELLQLKNEEESETWSATADKKLIKKMNSKDVKRQDTIWELIQTERHHCRNLKILQKIYSQGFLDTLHMSREMVDRLFPKLDDLIDVHMTFLQNLQDLQNRRPDHSVEHIGQTLVEQFEGDNAKKMKYAYGEFCCGHKDSVSLYKDLLSKDRKFQSFIKSCNNHSLCKKREIPDFLLLVTQRPSKYLTLIEAILKRTSDKKDRENLSHSLKLSKELLQYIDERVHEQERQRRLSDIYIKMDAKATTTYNCKKFKKSDILANGRKLVREGTVGLKSARGKVSEAIAVVLTDLIFFMQETNGKYTFYSPDNKSSVIPLFQLLVREKSDTRDSRGIYLISQNKRSPEMYELVCNTSSERQTWIRDIRAAAEKCPPDEEAAVPQGDDEEGRRQIEARSAKVREIIDQLQRKDLEIKDCCDEKNRLMVELLEIYSWKDNQDTRRPDSYGDEEGSEHLDALQAAIQEVSVTASRLTTMLQNNSNGAQLSRHVSSVGEHISSSYQIQPVPKRAETFAGFDSSFDINPRMMAKRLTEDTQDNEEHRGSPVQPERVDSDSEMNQYAENISYENQQLGHNDSVESGHYYDRFSSDGSSMVDMSSTSQLSVLVAGDHMTSIAELARSLHSIVHLTAKQGTAVESLRAQLAEANERINKLSAEVHDRKGGYRQHNQLEELRNLQETVRKQKQDLERQREIEWMSLERERSSVEEQRKRLERDAYELYSKKEELKKQRDMFQQQIDMWMQQHKDASISKNSSSPAVVQMRESTADRGEYPKDEGDDNNSPNTSSHRRSASADFCQAVESNLEKLRTGNFKATRRELPTRPDSSGNKVQSTPSFSAGKNQLPMHLLSAKNEQKTGVKAKQQIPQFSQSVAGHKGPQSGGVHQVLPFKLAASSSNSSPGLTGSNGNLSQQPGSGASFNSGMGSNLKAHPAAHHNLQQKSASASSLSGVLKLAETGKGRSSSLNLKNPPSVTDKGQGQRSSDVASSSGQHSQGQDKSREQRGPKSDSDVIYF